jgi:ornithine carbamoyltransferase
MKRDILTLWNLSKAEMDALFASAANWKRLRREGKLAQPLVGKTLGLLFDKPSTRTRLSFEAAMVQLGGTPLFINVKDTQLIRNEPIEDTARVLSRYLDGLAVRTYSQDLLTALAKWADIPVINALTDQFHPCQVLSDIFTIIERKGGYEGVKVAWVGDGNNVAHSWINAAAVLGFDLVCACPKGHHPAPWVIEMAKRACRGSVRVVLDPLEAVKNADVIYTDVWASMGQESEAMRRRAVFAGYQVNEAMAEKAKQDVLVMHCLPAHRGEEITAGVLEGKNSVVWDQAENKMHMHKAILEAFLK